MHYFDHAATTPISRHVTEVMNEMHQKLYGNPSSIHQAGREAKFYLEDARQTIASFLHAKDDEIIFTSGGTEANNLAIIGAALANKAKGNHIVTTTQEHHAVLHVMEYLESIGFSVSYVKPDTNGQVKVSQIERAIRANTILVSVMMVNNETGVIQPIQEIAQTLEDTEIIFHVDAVQACGHIPINVNELCVDLLSASAHKMNGPKGVGLLYKTTSVKLDSILFGGNQENGHRAGTENLISIIGFASATKVVNKERVNRMKQLTFLRDYLLEQLQEQAVPFEVNGDKSQAVPHIINIYFPWVKNDILLTTLDLAQIAVSSGSACSAGTIEPSHVLTTMFGQDSKRIFQSIRISFGHEQTTENVDVLVKELKKCYEKLKIRNEE